MVLSCRGSNENVHEKRHKSIGYIYVGLFSKFTFFPYQIDRNLAKSDPTSAWDVLPGAVGLMALTFSY